MERQPESLNRIGTGTLSRNHLGVPGLLYYRGLLSESEQADVLANVDASPWLDALKRRVQHYGYRYDYKARSINPTMFVGSLPEFAVMIGSRLVHIGLFAECPDQLIINEYMPGQGIAPHIDCEPCFKDRIATISLGAVYEMDFVHRHSKDTCSLVLELGSALILSDDARYLWKHGIKARKTDHGRPRGRRISLTFRNVVLALPKR